jgi:hypothetical protein
LVVPEMPGKLPDFVSWPSFPFEGDLRVKPLEPIADVEPPRDGEDIGSCPACAAPDEAYIWVSERWRVRAMDRPSGLPMVLILESRSHLDLGDLPNLLAAELGVMTVRLERAVRSLDGVARVHVNRWGDGSAHLHLWFLARPAGRLQLRGSFLSLWNDILPPVPDAQWRENLALVAAWLAEFGGRPLAEPPRIEWQAPSTFAASEAASATGAAPSAGGSEAPPPTADTPPPVRTGAAMEGDGGRAIGRATVDPSLGAGPAMTVPTAEPFPSPRDVTAPEAPEPAASAGAPEAVPAAGAAAAGLSAGDVPDGDAASGAITERTDRPAERQGMPAQRTSPESAGAAASAGGAKVAAS